MSADDVPNGLRIANAGFVFSLTWTAAMLGSQAIATLAAFGYSLGDLVPRATTVAFGVALICLGNVWPRLPTSRVPERKAAKSMRINRVWGWVMVIMGLAMVLQAPFSPLLYPLVRALHSHG
jgi:hypothetical protein